LPNSFEKFNLYASKYSHFKGPCDVFTALSFLTEEPFSKTTFITVLRFYSIKNVNLLSVIIFLLFFSDQRVNQCQLTLQLAETRKLPKYLRRLFFIQLFFVMETYV
jgi:hypothetical protein